MLSEILGLIQDPEKTYSGSWIQDSKKRRIPDPYLQHCPGGQLITVRIHRIRIRGTGGQKISEPAPILAPKSLSS
jgi:hypothetical protein